MKVECCMCYKIFDDEYIILRLVHDSMTNQSSLKPYCEKCYDEDKKKREVEYKLTKAEGG